MNYPNLRDKIKIVFFDIDDTLFAKDKDLVPETVIPTLKKLKAKGIIPAIASGRTNATFPPKIRELVEEVGIDTFVVMNGQYVTYQGEILARFPVDKAKVERAVRFFEEQGMPYAFVSEEGIFVSELTPETLSALVPLKTDYKVNKDYYKTHDVYQLLPFYDESKDELVANSGVLEGLKTVRWHPESVDLFDGQGSKARGILTALEHLNLDIQQAMAFGDGLNDIEMLTTVGVGVAVGNAHTGLKAVAPYETDHIEEQGIYTFLLKTGVIDD